MTKTLYFILSCWLMIASSVVGSSQTPSPALRGEMAKLEFLVGEWKGKGCRYNLDGSCGGDLSQSTKVKRGKDGSTLTISDKKKLPDLRMAAGVFPNIILSYPIESSGDISVSFDEGTNLYSARRETSAGRKHRLAVKLIDAKTLELKLETPDLSFLTTIRLTEDGKWHERLDVWLSERNSWTKFEESELTRVK